MNHDCDDSSDHGEREFLQSAMEDGCTDVDTDVEDEPASLLAGPVTAAPAIEPFIDPVTWPTAEPAAEPAPEPVVERVAGAVTQTVIEPDRCDAAKVAARALALEMRMKFSIVDVSYSNDSTVVVFYTFGGRVEDSDFCERLSRQLNVPFVRMKRFDP